MFVVGIVAFSISLLLSLLMRREAGRVYSDLSTSRLEARLSGLPILVSVTIAVLISRGWELRIAGVLLGAWVLVVILKFQERFRPAFVVPLVAVLSASLIAVAAGVRIEFIRYPLSADVVLVGRYMVPLSLLWLVGVTGAFYTAGRVEGLCLPLSAVASSSFLAVMALQRQDLALAQNLSFAVLGAFGAGLLLTLLGLRPPAGHLSSSLLGFLLGCASILGMTKTSTLLAFGLPLLLFAFPALGMTTVVYDHVRRRIVVTELRQDVYALLMNRGLAKHKVILFVTAAEAYLAMVAVLLALLRSLPLWSRFSILAVLAVGGLPVFGRFLNALEDTSDEPDRLRPAGLQLLGVRLDPIGMEEVLKKIQEFIGSGSPHHIVTSDTPAFVRAVEDQEFRELVNSAHLVTADGMGIVWAGRILGLPLRERVSGIDLMEAVCKLASENGYRIFLLGARPGVADEAARNLVSQFPGLCIVGTHHGYFSPEESPMVVELIRRCKPDVLFVAMGSPLQDYWIRGYLEDVGVPVCVGVGGSFDVLAGKLRRAPLWMRGIGLEWLYRAMQEPWRLKRLSGTYKVIGPILKKKLQSYWS